MEIHRQLLQDGVRRHREGGTGKGGKYLQVVVEGGASKAAAHKQCGQPALTRGQATHTIGGHIQQLPAPTIPGETKRGQGLLVATPSNLLFILNMRW